MIFIGFQFHIGLNLKKLLHNGPENSALLISVHSSSVTPLNPGVPKQTQKPRVVNMLQLRANKIAHLKRVRVTAAAKVTAENI
jgi:hypothetical protein